MKKGIVPILFLLKKILTEKKNLALSLKKVLRKISMFFNKDT